MSERPANPLPIPAVIRPWSRAWRLEAPEFVDDDDPALSSAPLTSSASSSILCSTFGEFANRILGFSNIPATFHCAWAEKTPTATVATSPVMAYRFIDPRPFLPPRAQRVMVQGRPLVMHAVTGRVHERNNDVAIGHFHPMPQEQVNFDVIRETMSNFLNVQLGIRTLSI